MSEHEVLELILTYAIPRRNVNPLAHSLINRYGSLSSVFSESAAGLASNDGISMHTATLLRLFGDTAKNSLFAKNTVAGVCIRNVGEAMELCAEILGSGKLESFCSIMLDARQCVVDYYIETGFANTTPMDTKRLVARAIGCGASGVVLAHSHPSGEAAASLADARLTERIDSMLSAMNIALFEHIIVTADDCYAMLHDVKLSTINRSDVDAKSAYRFRIG